MGKRHRINYEFVLGAARKTLEKWFHHPSALKRRSWSLTYREAPIDWHAGETPKPADKRLDCALWTYAPDRELVPAKPKRRRDDRDKYIAFELLVGRHVFGESIYALGKKFKMDPGDVSKQIKWAGSVLGIKPRKLPAGRKPKTTTRI